MKAMARSVLVATLASALVAWSFWPRNHELSAIGGFPAQWQDVRSSFLVSPDGLHAVFLADMTSNDVLEVFRVRLDGQGAPVRLSAPGQAFPYPGLYGAPVALTPDGMRVCYRTNSSSSSYSFYIVPLDGSAPPVQVQGFLAPEPRFAQGGERFVYASSTLFVGEITLWSGSLDGAAPVALLTYQIPFNTNPEYATSVTAEHVLFTRGLSEFDLELCSVRVDGSAPVLVLDAGLASNVPTSWLLSPDGTRAVYRVGPDLFSIPVDGSAPRVQLNPPLVAGGACTFAEVTPDAAHVVYRADQDTDQVFELYRVPIGGGPATQLNGSLVPLFSWRISPDSQRLAFLADPDANGGLQLFGVPLDGSAAPQELQGALEPWATVEHDFAFSPTSERLLFRSDQRLDQAFDLYTVAHDGSAPAVLVAEAPPAPGSILASAFAPDGASVAYVVHAGTSIVTEPVELHAVLADGSAPPVPISGPLVSGGSVRSLSGSQWFRFDASGRRIAYLADQERNETVELYASPLPRHPPRTRPR